MIPQNEATPPDRRPFLLSFAPEQWGEAERFVRYGALSHRFGRRDAAALSGVIGHFRKATALIRVARRLEEGMTLDREEVRARGYSDAHRSEEFAAVVEEVFGELYSCLDSARQVLKAVYPKAQGIPQDKTSKLFSNAAAGKLDPALPEPIRKSLADANADWFPGLRKIRTAVTHLSPGDCSPTEDGKVAYLNQALGTPTNSLEIEDVWGEIERYEEAVMNGLLGAVFRELNRTLVDERTREVCGVYAYRVYQRLVSPVEAQDFHSGVCASYEWFEKEENPTCPLSGTCGAYANARGATRESSPGP